MSQTPDGERDSKGGENSSKDKHSGVARPGNAPDADTDTAYSPNREQVSRRSSSETRNGHPKSLGSIASSGGRTEHSIIWRDLREKHAEVTRDRKSFRDLRAALDARQKAIDDEQAQLLKAMTAALTNSTTPTMKDVVDGFHVLQTSRQALSSEIGTLKQLERKLIADEEVLAELEKNAYAGFPSPNDFPEGFLDFTQNSNPETASIASIRTVAPPEKQEYDRCLKEVNVIRERLLDMQSENEQLLREQEKRSRLGRKLDAFSIQALNDFEDRFGSLTLELDRAQVKFELAEVNWTNRKKRMEGEADDSRAAQPTTAEEPSRERLEEDYDFQEATHEDTNDSLDSLEESNKRASAIAEILFQTENDSHPVYELPSEAENGEAINQARFINQWLLQRIQQSPVVTRHFATELANAFPSFDTKELVDFALSSWLNDSMEDDFLANVEKGEESKAEKPSGTSSGRFEWTGTNSS